jgi:hypothetical protein
MTGQIADSFLYEGEVYSLIGYTKGEPFTPVNYGILPKAPHTACWRGFVLYYKLDDNKLLLQDMQLHADDAGEINGVIPKESENSFKFHYQDLNLVLNYSGKIKIAKDFIQEMYVHMGFQRASAFKTVLELDFKDGNLIQVNDLSDKMKKHRKKDPAKDAEPKSMKETDVKEWIKKTFSRKYKQEDE